MRAHACETLETFRADDVAPELIALLADARDDVRVCVGKFLVSSQVSDAVPAVAHWLADNDPQIRVAAVEVLGQVELASASGVSPALRALGDSDSTVRRAALLALGQLYAVQSSTAIVEGIVGRLDDDQSAVRETAAVVLQKIADPRAALPLIGRLDDSSRPVRIAAVLALGATGDERATVALLRVLHDPQPDVRRAAIRALGKIGGTRAITALLPLARGENTSIRLAALYALAEVAPKTVTPEMMELALALLQERDAQILALARAIVAGPKRPGGSSGDDWIWIEVQNEAGVPQANQPYALELPNGLIKKGVSDAAGIIREDGIPVGTCYLRLE